MDELPMWIAVAILLASFVVYGAASAWLRKQAERSKQSHGIEAQKARMAEQAKQRAEQQKKSEACAYCGAKLARADRECRKCGAAI
jgi:hypothetical protein